MIEDARVCCVVETVAERSCLELLNVRAQAMHSNRADSLPRRLLLPSATGVTRSPCIAPCSTSIRTHRAGRVERTQARLPRCCLGSCWPRGWLCRQSRVPRQTPKGLHPRRARPVTRSAATGAASATRSRRLAGSGTSRVSRSMTSSRPHPGCSSPQTCNGCARPTPRTRRSGWGAAGARRVLTGPTQGTVTPTKGKDDGQTTSTAHACLRDRTGRLPLGSDCCR